MLHAPINCIQNKTKLTMLACPDLFTIMMVMIINMIIEAKIQEFHYMFYLVIKKKRI